MIGPEIHYSADWTRKIGAGRAIEIYIHRGEFRCFLTIESAPRHMNRVIEYILNTFLGCSVDDPVWQRAVKSCQDDETDLAELSRQASNA